MAVVPRVIGELEQALVSSIEAKGNIPEEFQGLTMLGRMYAYNIDEAAGADTETATKALYLGPHLLGVMKLLGIAPTGISEVKTEGFNEKVLTGTNVLKVMEEMKKRDGA